MRVGNVEMLAIISWKFCDLASKIPQTDNMAWTCSSCSWLSSPGTSGKLGIEDRIALCLPPEPVLHNGVERDVLLTVAVRDFKHLILRNVPVLRLKKAIRPLRQHWSMPGKVPILVDESVHLRTVDEVIVDRRGLPASASSAPAETGCPHMSARPFPHQP